MKKIISATLLAILLFEFVILTNSSYARYDENIKNDTKTATTNEPRTGHTKKEAQETIAAWCKDFYNKHVNQCSYDFSFGYPREHSYSLPVSDGDTSTQYVFDCVGFVSFAIHHAIGIGDPDWDIFASPSAYEPGNVSGGLEPVTVPFGQWQPGDVIIMPHHVAIYVGNGMNVEMWQSGLVNVEAETAVSNNGGYSGYVGRITEEAARNANFKYLEGASFEGVDGILEMKGNKIADCAFEYDGVSGDSAGYEYQVKDWFTDGGYYNWDVVYRYPDQEVARKIATIAVQAANNDNIGYFFDGEFNTSSRSGSYGRELEKANFDPTAITTKCDSICSWSTTNAIKAAGYQLNIEKLKNIPLNGGTDDGAGNPSTGFEKLTDRKYLDSCSELIAGDILRTYPDDNVAGHATIFVGGGKIGTVSSTHQQGDWDIDPITVNLDEQEFQFAGLPKNVTYHGTKSNSGWVFEKISQFADFITGLLVNGLKMSILGWVMTIEGAIDASIKYVEEQ